MSKNPENGRPNEKMDRQLSSPQSTEKLQLER